MNRRTFFGRLAAALAGAVVAPYALLAKPKTVAYRTYILGSNAFFVRDADCPLCKAEYREQHGVPQPEFPDPAYYENFAVDKICRRHDKIVQNAAMELGRQAGLHGNYGFHWDVVKADVCN